MNQCDEFDWIDLIWIEFKVFSIFSITSNWISILSFYADHACGILFIILRLYWFSVFFSRALFSCMVIKEKNTVHTFWYVIQVQIDFCLYPGANQTCFICFSACYICYAVASSLFQFEYTVYTMCVPDKVLAFSHFY